MRPSWYLLANINFVVGLTRLDVRNFAFENREITKLIDLELARLIVDFDIPEPLRELEKT